MDDILGKKIPSGGSLSLPSVDRMKPKFFATFPYPYSNGMLHLGHGFTLMKVDAQAKFKNLTGYNVLFPFAFHCTGMPIKAAADKLAKEISLGINELSDRNDKQPYQFHILLDMNIPIENVSEFVNYKKWFDYFPQKGIEHLKRMGLSVDWRRSFITTPENPYYSKFVEWFLTKLKKKGLIKYGNQYTVWSIKDNQACSDHARKTGEGVRPTRHTMFKVPIGDSPSIMFGSRTFLCGILNARDEDECANNSECGSSMDGKYVELENVYVYPNVLYGIYELKNSDYVICDEQTAMILAYQGHTSKLGEIKKISEMKGTQLLQCNVLSNRIGGIPIEVTKDTGTPTGIGKLTNVSDCIDTSVTAFDYYTLDTPVITRTNDKCIVAYVPQWFVDYSNEQWKETVRIHIKDNMTGNPQTKQELLDTVNWLHEKSIGRDANQSIGTRIPWDKQYTIDSLCDSTVYMMYYTIAHYLHKDTHGQERADLSLSSWTFEVMDYIFLNGTPPPGIYLTDSPGSSCGVKLVDIKLLDKMREEFCYWYPLDLRVSGKDLIRNHLAFCLFQHVALVGSELSPKEFRVNGYITIDHKKMSKSEGNFITLEQAFDEFDVDPTRFALAYAGDDCNADANFEKSIAISIKSKLVSKLEWIIPVMKQAVIQALLEVGSYGDEDPVYNPNTDFFKNRMKMCFANAKIAYEEFRLKDVCYWAFFELEKYRKQYEFFCEESDCIVLRDYIGQQATVLSPIIPYYSAWVLETYFSACTAVLQYPTNLVYDTTKIVEADFYNDIWKELNQNVTESTKGIKITFVERYPDWVNEINAIITQSKPSKMKDIAQTLHKHNVDKLDRRNIMTTVKSGGVIATENVVDFTNVNVVLEIMSTKLTPPIEIQFKIIDQDKDIIPTKPKILFL
jgi:leucyl-tRNA synthetase